MSATALLGSPDDCGYVYQFAEEDYQSEYQNGSTDSQYKTSVRSGVGIWECLIGCRHRLDQQLARRRVSIKHFDNFFFNSRKKIV